MPGDFRSRRICGSASPYCLNHVLGFPLSFEGVREFMERHSFGTSNHPSIFDSSSNNKQPGWPASPMTCRGREFRRRNSLHIGCSKHSRRQTVSHKLVQHLGSLVDMSSESQRDTYSTWSACFSDRQNDLLDIGYWLARRKRLEFGRTTAIFACELNVAVDAEAEETTTG